MTTARQLIVELIAVDPLTPLTRCMPAWADILDGKLAAAVEPYRQMFDMDPSDPMARLFYVWILILNRHTERSTGWSGHFLRRCGTRFRHVSRSSRARRRRTTRPSACYGPAGDREQRPRQTCFPAPRPGLRARGYREQALQSLAVTVDRGFINYPFLTRHDRFFLDVRRENLFDG